MMLNLYAMLIGGDKTKRYVQQTKLLAGDRQASDQFGRNTSLSFDGNTALVSAHLEDPGGLSNAGSAYVFIRSGSTWTEQAKLVASDALANDQFSRGIALSSDGSVALFGAPNADPGGVTNAGAAYVFTRSGSTWTQQAKLVASDLGAEDTFGSAVALSADANTALIGAPLEDPGGASNAGAAYVFTRSGSTWTEQAKLVASDPEGLDEFGFSVALSADGNTALVGAYLEDPGGVSAGGSTYVFIRSGSTWTQQAKLVASDVMANEQFGVATSLSFDGNTALIGAFGGIVAGLVAGSAYVFTRSGSTWTQQAKLVASDPEGSDQFGLAVALSADANTALIGAPLEDPGGASNAGAAYVFTRSGSTWTQNSKLVAGVPQLSSQFGRGVALSAEGNTLLIGANLEDPAGLSDAGAAYIFAAA